MIKNSLTFFKNLLKNHLAKKPETCVEASLGSVDSTLFKSWFLRVVRVNNQRGWITLITCQDTLFWFHQLLSYVRWIYCHILVLFNEICNSKYNRGSDPVLLYISGCNGTLFQLKFLKKLKVKRSVYLIFTVLFLYPIDNYWHKEQ